MEVSCKISSAGQVQRFRKLKSEMDGQPGSPGVKTSPSNTEGVGSTPGQGTHPTCLTAKIPNHKAEAILQQTQ